MTVRIDHYLRTLPGRGLSGTQPSPVRIEGGPEGEPKKGGLRFFLGYDRFSYGFLKLPARGKPFRFRVVVLVAPIPFSNDGENQLPAAGGMKAMELRQLTTERERRIFGERMVEARAKRGAGFRETRRSKLGKIHLEYGMLCGLFEHDDDLPEQMMSGFAMHDLASFPQSYPRPDLSHLPARSVIEGGELWSFAKGAGLLAQYGSMILGGLMQIQAFLVYPTVKPSDQTATYVRNNFVKAGDPIAFPYGETTDGGEVWVQPMVLEGERLAMVLHRVFELGFATSDSMRRIRFDNPFATEPTLSRPAIPTGQHLATVESAALHGHEVNGDAQA